MIKKILVSLCLAAAILVGVSADGTTLPTAQADYAQYYNGDSNYPLVYGHQGVAWYLDKSSIVVKKNDSEGNAFACNVITVNETGNISGTKTYWYYKVAGEDMGTAYSSPDGQNWQAFEVGSTFGYMQVLVKTFKIGWYAAFGYSYS